MAHIVVFAPPAAGHINPTLGVVSELVTQGHRVTYATTEEYAERVRETGAETLTYQTCLAPDEPYELTHTDLIRGLLDGLRETEALVPELTGWFERNQPDLVIFDGLTAWWGRLLAQNHGIPSVAAWPNFVSNKHWDLAETYIKPNKLDFRLWRFAFKMTLLARRSKLTLTELVDSIGTNVRGQLVFLPRSFQFANETFGEEYDFVGPCLGDRAFQGEWTAPSDGRRVCLVSLGTVYNAQPKFFATVVESFRDLPWHVVLSIGDQVDPAELGDVPDNVEIRRSVPQLRVLSNADLFITHAGMGSVMEALHYGVPMITLPQMAEQRANADRVSQLNVGRQLDNADVSPHELREAVLAVSDAASIRESIAALRQEMRESGGTKVAVDVIERALNG